MKRQKRRKQPMNSEAVTGFNRAIAEVYPPDPVADARFEALLQDLRGVTGGKPAQGTTA